MKQLEVDANKFLNEFYNNLCYPGFVKFFDKLSLYEQKTFMKRLEDILQQNIDCGYELRKEEDDSAYDDGYDDGLPEGIKIAMLIIDDMDDIDREIREEILDKLDEKL